jgi:hypothetical protein
LPWGPTFCFVSIILTNSIPLRTFSTAYDPSNAYFRQASEFFWDRYKQEVDSWRDQPLWAYTLHHFGIEPLTMRHDTLHSYILEDFELKGDHHYDEHSVSYAAKPASAGGSAGGRRGGKSIM